MKKSNALVLVIFIALSAFLLLPAKYPASTSSRMKIMTPVASLLRAMLFSLMNERYIPRAASILAGRKSEAMK